jgi:hypothetical protein
MMYGVRLRRSFGLEREEERRDLHVLGINLFVVLKIYYWICQIKNCEFDEYVRSTEKNDNAYKFGERT